eukprot:scaffold102_cov340-Pavlova_lutheri.AAC.66
MDVEWTARRLAKERFVEGHGGSNAMEVLGISSLVPMDLWLGSLLLNHWERRVGTACTLPRVLVELALVFLPTMLVYLSFVDVGTMFYLHAALVLILLMLLPKPSKMDARPKSAQENCDYLSAYRASMMIVSCIAILAVDFPAFPRRFAKAENYGYGLMDVGVGSFVLATALVSRIGRSEKFERSQILMSTLRKSSVLFILGIGRTLLTRQIDYQLHVGEYGVHWNFFITQGVLSLVPLVVCPLSDFALLLGTLLLSGHQYLLMRTGGALNNYIHGHARTHYIIDMNKEGIYSLPGYVSLYLIGAGLARMLKLTTLPWNATRKHARNLLFVAAGLWLCFCQAERVLEPASRRTCNLTYVLWMLAFNFSMIFLFMVASAAMRIRQIHLVAAVNRHLMSVFLLANVLTGFVNLTMDTLNATREVALAVVALYAASTSLSAYVLPLSF